MPSVIELDSPVRSDDYENMLPRRATSALTAHQALVTSSDSDRRRYMDDGMTISDEISIDVDDA
ncbi:hypothetical protein CKO41_06705 [Thiococcus pfennigii]|jgi:hypothetical protein|nr:hypothetical protein [Thiococcus pfennigii]MBK1731488.1 hypothetical protein [Thiococcus pfennigii]